MEGFQQYPNLSSLRLVKLEGWGKDQEVRIGAFGPSNRATESIKMPPLLPSFDQQTKRIQTNGGTTASSKVDPYNREPFKKHSELSGYLSPWSPALSLALKMTAVRFLILDASINVNLTSHVSVLLRVMLLFVCLFVPKHGGSILASGKESRPVCRGDHPPSVE
ncbi:hypothetical protein Peur_003621 [Populus x canadensis]